MARSGKRGSSSRPASPPAPTPAPVAPPSPLPPAPVPYADRYVEQRLLAGPATLDREVLAWLMLGLFALFVAAFSVLRMPGKEGGNPLTYDRAAFASVSAVTLTGIRQDVEVRDQWYVPVTYLGVTVGAAFLTLLAGGLPACRVLGLQHPPRHVAAAAAAVVLGGTLLGGLALLGHGRPAAHAFLLAASAVGNSGVTGVPVGDGPRADGWAAHGVLFPLAFVGGLGLPVVLDLFDRARGRTRELLPHTRIVLTLAAALYVVGAVLILLADHRLVDKLQALSHVDSADGSQATRTWKAEQWRSVRSIVVDAAAYSADARSAGFTLAGAPVSALPQAVQWVTLLLMAIGAGPASTAGGLKTTTLHALCRAVRQAMRGERLSPAAGFAVCWALAFLGLVSVGALLVLRTSPQTPPDRALYLAVSAASNGGLSHDPIALVSAPLLLLAAVMALGRVVPILLGWVMASRVDYAETTVG